MSKKKLYNKTELRTLIPIHNFFIMLYKECKTDVAMYVNLTLSKFHKNEELPKIILEAISNNNIEYLVSYWLKSGYIQYRVNQLTCSKIPITLNNLKATPLPPIKIPEPIKATIPKKPKRPKQQSGKRIDR